MKRGRKPKSERNAQVIEMRKSGMTYKNIGAALGITKGRVCQICLGENVRKGRNGS